jgi:polynucleotide 5'-kinase involved in rRNA processing
LPVRKLEEVFIPLTLRLSKPPTAEEVLTQSAKSDDLELCEHQAYLRLVDRQKRQGDIVPLEKLLTVKNRLAIIGGAGSGKSTLAAYLAYSLAEAAQTGR